MADDNIEVMRRFLEAVFAGKYEHLSQYIHPNFELHHSRTVPYAGVYKGAEGFLEFLDLFMNSFDPLDLQPGEIFTAPSGALVTEISLDGQLKSTGKRMSTSMLEKWEFEDGKIFRITPHYFDPTPD